MNDELRKEVMAGAVAQGFNEAKSAIMRCAESMPNDDDMLSVAVGASVNVTAATIEAILGLKDNAAELATLRFVDERLIPLIEQLRVRVTKEENLS
jgi:hypothetical protein